MLSKRPDQFVQQVDGSVDMIGRCRVCGLEVRAKRRDCRAGHFDLVYAECPVCKAKSPTKSGGAVEMYREQFGPQQGG